MASGHVDLTGDRIVLITGATGFTGSALVESYARAGWKVHGTYRDEPEDLAWLPPDVTLHHVDLLEGDATDRLFRNVNPAVLQHMAARSSVAASWADPLGTLNENARMQFNLLEALRRSPGTRAILAGSCDEYGVPTSEVDRFTEDSPLHPVNPYALSKVTQDLMGLQYAVVYGLQVIRVRPFLQLGPRRASNFVAGSFARQVAEIETGLHAPVIEVGNIDLRRDFTDVRDVARACRLLAEAGQPGEAYNIATGESHSLREILEIMMRAAGVQAEIRSNPRLLRGAEPELIVGDSTKLRQETGWVPEISFQQSAVDTLDYWRSRVRRERIPEGDLA